MYFPHLNPIAFQIGPLAIRWYGLAYLLAFFWVQWLGKRRLSHEQHCPLSHQQFEDLMFWCMLGVILGGRIGYMGFYQFSHWLAHPLAVFQVWQGGMSFHGGLLGALLAGVVFAQKRHLSCWRLADFMVPMVPIGLGLGRAANFINGELWGRPTHAAWGMIYPWVDHQLRHPSQLYELALEGCVLYGIMALLRRQIPPSYEGVLTCCFMAIYGMLRCCVECFRAPDAQLGLFGALHVSMGQMLSLPMVVIGLWGMVYCTRRQQGDEV